MKLWIPLLLFSLIVLIPKCWGDDLSLGVSLGKGVLGEKGTPFERSFQAGYQFNLKRNFFLRPELGIFEDLSGVGKSSFWAAPLVGVKTAGLTGSEYHLGFGPGYLQNPDALLGGHFQFSLEAGFGISDQFTYIGLAWKHLSSAGFELPNLGRDLITIQLRFLGF